MSAIRDRVRLFDGDRSMSDRTIVGQLTVVTAKRRNMVTTKSFVRMTAGEKCCTTCYY